MTRLLIGLYALLFAYTVQAQPPCTYTIGYTLNYTMVGGGTFTPDMITQCALYDATGIPYIPDNYLTGSETGRDLVQIDPFCSLAFDLPVTQAMLDDSPPLGSMTLDAKLFIEDISVTPPVEYGSAYTNQVLLDCLDAPEPTPPPVGFSAPMPMLLEAVKQ